MEIESRTIILSTPEELFPLITEAVRAAEHGKTADVPDLPGKKLLAPKDVEREFGIHQKRGCKKFCVTGQSCYSGTVGTKAVYLALGVTMSGVKELSGMWISPNEGAKFWLSVVTELRNRGVQDIFIACVDGLKGFPEAIENVFPKTRIQLCIVHLVRNSLKYVGWKERKYNELRLAQRHPGITPKG